MGTVSPTVSLAFCCRGEMLRKISRERTGFVWLGDYSPPSREVKAGTRREKLKQRLQGRNAAYSLAQTL